MIGESRANGNGVTPPGTPGAIRRTHSASGSSPRSSPSRSLSPMPSTNTPSDTSGLVSSLTRDSGTPVSGSSRTARRSTSVHSSSPSPSLSLKSEEPQVKLTAAAAATTIQQKVSWCCNEQVKFLSWKFYPQFRVFAHFRLTSQRVPSRQP